MKPFNPTPDPYRQKVEAPFEVKPEAHFVLNDIAEKILGEEGLSIEERDLLKNLFVELQGLEHQDVIVETVRLRDTKRIDTHEMLLVASLVMTSRSIGPDMSEAFNEFSDLNLPPEKFVELLSKVSLPEHSREVVGRCYKKLKGVL